MSWLSGDPSQQSFDSGLYHAYVSLLPDEVVGPGPQGKHFRPGVNKVRRPSQDPKLGGHDST